MVNINCTLEIINSDNEMTKHYCYNETLESVKDLAKYLSELDKTQITSIYLSTKDNKDMNLDIVKDNYDIISIKIHTGLKFSYKYSMVLLYYYNMYLDYIYQLGYLSEDKHEDITPLDSTKKKRKK